jgi:mevalonate kinase
MGEYSCLIGNPAIVATLEPSFTLTANLKTDAAFTNAVKVAHSFHSASPAGKLLAANRNLLHAVDLEWQDPYITPIGVGSSSAQFILVANLIQTLKKQSPLTKKQLLDLYWQMSSQEQTQSVRPSGLDVLAQSLGGTNYLSAKPECELNIEPLQIWDSHESEFLLAYSSQKTPTHSHLLDLSRRGFPGNFTENIKALNELTLESKKAWLQIDAHLFGRLMNDYQNELDLCKFAENDIIERVTWLQKIPGVLGSKGAGAQGGDCALVLIDKNMKSHVLEKIKSTEWLPIVPKWSSRE